MGFLIHVCQSNLPPVCKNPTVALQLHRAGAVETSKHVGAPSCQNSLRRLLNRTCLLILRHFSAHVRISFATCSLVLFVSMMADFAEATTADCKSRLHSPWIFKFSVFCGSDTFGIVFAICKKETTISNIFRNRSWKNVVTMNYPIQHPNFANALADAFASLTNWKWERRLDV